MYLTETNGYWYIRHDDGSGTETIAKLGQHENRPAIYRPQLVQDKAENVLARLPDDSVDCIVTDPPYGVEFESNMDEYDGAHQLGGLMNDTTTEFLDELAPEFSRVLKDDGHCYVFTRWDVYPEMLAYFRNVLELNALIVWDKMVSGMGNLETWAPRHEFIMHLCHDDPSLRGGRPDDIQKFAGPNTGAVRGVQVHPTQKPREMMEFLIEKSTKAGDVVLDPFGGSYATARAAMRTFRRAVSCELDPETHRAAVDLSKKQLRDDPEHGTDWTEVTNLRVEDVDLLKPLTTP